MYKRRTSLVLGFHAIDKEKGTAILNNQDNLKPSKNEYDWLGSGVYFWENNLERAWDYAHECVERKSSTIKTAYVLGAVIDLGNCLDLLEHNWLNKR